MKVQEDARRMNYEDRFSEIVVEDEDHVKKIASITADRMEKIFGISFRLTEKGPQEPKIPVVVFAETYDAIIDHLVKRKKGLIKLDSERSSHDYNSFKINFANRFVIGFDNVDNENDEKDGNYMIYINDIRDGKAVEEPLEPDEDPSKKTTEWINQNITEHPEAIKMISIEAREHLKKLGIGFTNHELIFPIFCTMYDVLVDYMDLFRKETNEYFQEINFAGCFFVAAYENEEGGSDIVFRPSIDSKTALKDDATSGSSN